MKEIEKLIQIFSKFGPSKLPLLNQNKSENISLENSLYQNIKDGKYHNEEDAIIDLYGSDKEYYKYRMLKSRLKQKLYNQILFIENDTVVSKKEEKKCLDLFHKGNILLQVGEILLAEKLFKQVISIATDFEFTRLALWSYENLKIIYLQSQRDGLLSKTEDKIEHFKNLKMLEDQAMSLYFTSKIKLAKSIASKQTFIKEIPQIIQQLHALWLQTKSFNIFQWYYYLNVWYLKLTKQYEASIISLEQSEKYLKEGKVNVRRFDHRANKYSHVSALLRTRQFDKGLTLAKDYIKSFDPYSRNWFAFMEYYFLMALHAERFSLAADLLDEVNKNPYLKRLKPVAVENWKLYESYFYFLKPSQNNAAIFQYQEFIASVPVHSKDKLGHNISILVLQFLYLLKNKEYEQLCAKEESLRKYAHNYLKTEHSKRSFYFFKLMLLVIRADFDPEKSIRKGKRWCEKLKNTLEPGDAYAEVEIIPYERLWEIVVELLE